MKLRNFNAKVTISNQKLTDQQRTSLFHHKRFSIESPNLISEPHNYVAEICTLHYRKNRHKRIMVSFFKRQKLEKTRKEMLYIYFREDP